MYVIYAHCVCTWLRCDQFIYVMQQLVLIVLIIICLYVHFSQFINNVRVMNSRRWWCCLLFLSFALIAVTIVSHFFYTKHMTPGVQVTMNIMMCVGLVISLLFTVSLHVTHIVCCLVKHCRGHLNKFFRSLYIGGLLCPLFSWDHN